MNHQNAPTFLSTVFKLIERGLSGDQIDNAMRQMVGNDWREIPVSTWLARLQDKNYITEINKDLYLEELEVLIKHRTIFTLTRS